MRALGILIAALAVAAPMAAAEEGEDPLAGLPLPIGSPWSDEGLGGLAADAGEAVGELYVDAMTGGLGGTVLQNAAVPSPSGPAAPDDPGLAVPDPGSAAAPAEAAPFALPSPGEAGVPDAVGGGPPGPALAPAPPPDGAAGDVASAIDGAVRALATAHAGGLGLVRERTGVVDVHEEPRRPAVDAGAAGPGGAPGVAGRGLAGHESLAGDEVVLAVAEPAPASGDQAGPPPAAEVAASLADPARLRAPGTLANLAAWAMSLLATILYHRIGQGDVLAHPGRRALYEAIQHRPGTTIEAASRSAGLHRGTALHHLRVLLRNRLVTRVPGTKEVHLFAAGADRPETLGALTLLARARPRAVAALVAQRPGMTRSEIARCLGVTPSTMDWHVGGLLGRGLVVEHREHARRGLHPTPLLLVVLAPPAGATPAAALAAALP